MDDSRRPACIRSVLPPSSRPGSSSCRLPAAQRSSSSLVPAMAGAPQAYCFLREQPFPNSSLLAASAISKVPLPVHLLQPSSPSRFLACSVHGRVLLDRTAPDSFSSSCARFPLPLCALLCPCRAPALVAVLQLGFQFQLRVPLQFAQPGRIPCRLHPWLLCAAAILPGARPRPRRRLVAPAPLLLPRRSPRSSSPCLSPSVYCDAWFQLASQILCVAPSSDFAGHRSLTRVPVGVV